MKLITLLCKNIIVAKSRKMKITEPNSWWSRQVCQSLLRKVMAKRVVVLQITTVMMMMIIIMWCNNIGISNLQYRNC
jgi:hypothetical protein